ncbi:MAG: tetratricopeptide repeat protein [Acidobacteriota bacterium]|nr:tetratricopeptide repeat protein [Acidobacteriota bacterium]
MKWIVFAAALALGIPAAHAQLPAGTTDTTTHPQATPQDPLRAEANAALDKQDYATAVKLLSVLAEKHANDARLLYDLGFAQDALDQSTAAESSYRRAITADASYFEPHLALGLLLARGGKPDEAHAELTTAVGLPTENVSLRARGYRALARLDEAARPAAASEELLAAIKISPETPDDILLSGELAEASGDAVAAEAAYRRLIRTDPRNQDATAALAHLLMVARKPDQAESLLTAALAKSPDDPTLNAQLAAVYEQTGKTAQAVPLIEKLYVAHAGDATIGRLLAGLYSRSGQYDKAAPLYAALVARSPGAPTLLDESADVQIHLHNYAQAEALLQRAVAMPGAFPSKESLGEAASHLAFAASANNNPTTTLQALAIRDRLLPPSASSLFLAATAHDKLHHTKQAADLYKQFLSVANGKYPDEEWEARHRLITLDHM